jgi:hypothetical protein
MQALFLCNDTFLYSFRICKFREVKVFTIRIRRYRVVKLERKLILYLFFSFCLGSDKIYVFLPLILVVNLCQDGLHAEGR